MYESEVPKTLRVDRNIEDNGKTSRFLLDRRTWNLEPYEARNHLEKNGQVYVAAGNKPHTR